MARSGKPKKAPRVAIQKGPSRNYMREADQMKRGGGSRTSAQQPMKKKRLSK